MDITQIINFENIKDNSGEVQRSVMTVKNGSETKQYDVYLAFTDTNTGKRYLLYTDNPNAEKISCDFAAITTQEGIYIFEPTSEEDYKNIQLPAIDLIGKNSQKPEEEIRKMLLEKHSNILELNIEDLQKNIDRIAVSSTKPARKANIPVVIANGIKKYYLARVNSLLKKVSNATQMSEKDANKTIKKLDKFGEKLTGLEDTYRASSSAKSQQSLDQIANAKIDIEEAKAKIDAITESPVENKKEENIADELPETPQEEVVPESVVEPEVAVEQSFENVTPSVDTATKQTTSANNLQPEMSEMTTPGAEEVVAAVPSPVANNASLEQAQDREPKTMQMEDRKSENFDVETIMNKINHTLSEIIAAANDRLSDSLFNIITRDLLQSVIELYQDQIKAILKGHSKETADLTETVSKLTSQLKEAMEKMEALNSVNKTLTNQNQKLEQDNKALLTTVDDQKRLLDTQNSNMDDLREKLEEKGKENKILSDDNASLRNQNNDVTKKYTELAGRFDGVRALLVNNVEQLSAVNASTVNPELYVEDTLSNEGMNK